jgi:hypothetical protein
MPQALYDTVMSAAEKRVPQKQKKFHTLKMLDTKN